MPQSRPRLLDVLTESEAQLLVEALNRLRVLKSESLNVLKTEGIKPGGRDFQPHDFGIPQIDDLLARLDEEPDQG
jgi:hypothetical protein